MNKQELIDLVNLKESELEELRNDYVLCKAEGRLDDLFSIECSANKIKADLAIVQRRIKALENAEKARENKIEYVEPKIGDVYEELPVTPEVATPQPDIIARLPYKDD